MIKNLLRLLVFLFIPLTNVLWAAPPIVVTIKMNGTVVVPGPSKNVQICQGSVFNLEASNTSTSKPAGTPVYKWQNIDSMITINSNPINRSEAGRWVATISYFSSSTGWTMASDTVFISYFSPQPLKITTANGAAITSSTINVCGTRDSIFKATPGFTNYNWYKDNYSNLVSTTSSVTITNAMLPASDGVVSFFVTATDANGCAGANAQQNFRRDVSVNVDLGNDTTVCAGKPVILSSPSSLPPSIIISYKWNTGATTSTYTTTLPGKYKLTITNNGSKCFSYDSVSVFNNPIPLISITKDTSICFQTSVQLNASVTTGTGPFVYKWNPSSDLSSTSISNPVATPPAITNTYTYSVQVTDPIGCASNVTSTHITVLPQYVNPYFTLDAGADTLVCYQTANQLTPVISGAVYPSTYTWQWGPAVDITNTTSQNPTVTLVSSNSQKYGVIVTDSRGCQKMDSVLVTNRPEVTAYTSFTDSTSCFEDTVTVVAAANGGYSFVYTYNFSPASAGTQNTNTFQVPLINDSYTINVSATDSKGCTSKNVVVTLGTDKPSIQIAAGADTVAFGDAPLVIVANISPANSTVEWYDLPANNHLTSGTSYTSTQDESIYAIATNTHGCKNSDSLNITHITANMHVLYIPNVFSPQAANTENQKLKVYGTLIQEDGFRFRIYNQWGQLVYQTNSFIEANTSGWTGDVKNNDGKQSTNVYTYTVEGKFYDGETFNKAGTSTMLF